MYFCLYLHHYFFLCLLLFFSVNLCRLLFLFAYLSAHSLCPFSVFPLALPFLRPSSVLPPSFLRPSSVLPLSFLCPSSVLPPSSFVFLRIPLSSSVFICLSLSTSNYLFLPLPTSVYMFPSQSAYIHLYSPIRMSWPVLASWYLFLPHVCTWMPLIRLCGLLSGSIQTCLLISTSMCVPLTNE